MLFSVQQLSANSSPASDAPDCLAENKQIDKAIEKMAIANEAFFNCIGKDSITVIESPSAKAHKAWLDTARKYLYVREKGPNRSPDIDRWNKFVGNALGSSYCGAFAGYCKNQGGGKWKFLSGLAQAYFTHAPKNMRHTALEVIQGKYKPVEGDMIIWGKGNTFYGHIGFVNVDWVGISGFTIEANTSSGESGSQANGDGVFIRRRTIYRYQYFRIIGFIHFE